MRSNFQKDNKYCRLIKAKNNSQIVQPVILEIVTVNIFVAIVQNTWHRLLCHSLVRSELYAANLKSIFDLLMQHKSATQRQLKYAMQPGS